jgi:putative ABC transport system permease protein
VRRPEYTGRFSLHAPRLTLRALIRRRAYTGLALALISLATAAATATFAVVRATLWRDLPYREPDALANIYGAEPVNRDSTQRMASSAAMLVRWRENTRALAGVEGYSPVSVSLAGDGEPEALAGAAVSAGLFDLLGTTPTVGRSFRHDEEVAGSGVIVISDAVAQRRFGSARAALGKALLIDGAPMTVIGIMPPGFSLLFQGGDAWIPLDLSAAQQARVALRMIVVYGRLRPGISMDQARSDIASIQRELAVSFPETYANTQIGVQPLREALFGNRRGTMLALLGSVSLILLIAVVNFANLTLADAISRRGLTMTRIALGASARSLIGARVRETVILATVSFAAAVPLAALVLAALTSITPDPLTPLGDRYVDAATIAAGWLIALGVAVVGALPAIALEARTDVTGIAGSAARAGASRDGRPQLVLSAAQAMITVVLIGVAITLTRDLGRLMSTPTGFVTENVVVARMNVLSRERTTVPARAQYADALVRSVNAVPGVVEASAIQTRFVLNETMQSAMDVEGFTPSGARPASQIRHVMPNVFRVLGVRILAGRGIDSTDRAEARPVAVVSRAFAATYWPGESAIGKRIRRGAPGSPWLEVVGVVDDVADAGLGVPLGPTMYVPYLQQNTATARVTLVVKTRVAASTLTEPIRRAIWAVNPSQAIDDITPLTTLMARSAAQPRFRTAVVSVFGASAGTLVVAGVYAVTLFGVLSRRRELGVRAAMGASPRSLVFLAQRRGLHAVLIGGGAGALAMVPVTRLTSTLVGSPVQSGDLLMSLAGVLLLLAVAALAALLPAIGAARVSPTEAIRVA